MYNRIGLQTPRGSGTSGYVQANMSYQKPIRSKLDFLKQMRKLKENTLAVNFQANPEIIKHKQKREIYVLLENMRQELLKSGKEVEEVEEILKEAEAKMLEKFESGELDIKIDKDGQLDNHQLAELKKVQEAKIRSAFKIENDYKYGSAFDFELQEKLRLEAIYQKELKKLEELQKANNLAEDVTSQQAPPQEFIDDERLKESRKIDSVDYSNTDKHHKQNDTKISKENSKNRYYKSKRHSDSDKQSISSHSSSEDDSLREKNYAKRYKKDKSKEKSKRSKKDRKISKTKEERYKSRKRYSSNSSSEQSPRHKSKY